MFINCVIRMTQETFCHSLLTFMLFKTSIKHNITDIFLKSGPHFTLRLMKPYNNFVCNKLIKMRPN